MSACPPVGWLASSRVPSCPKTPPTALHVDPLIEIHRSLTSAKYIANLCCCDRNTPKTFSNNSPKHKHFAVAPMSSGNHNNVVASVSLMLLIFPPDLNGRSPFRPLTSYIFPGAGPRAAINMKAI